MRLLLDTHAFIWWDNDHARLSSRALEACEDSHNILALSLASVWELQIKTQLGKLHLRLPLADLLNDQVRNGLSIEPVTLQDVLSLSDLPMVHRDPFDRLLIAQARRGGFCLLSHDPEMYRYDVSVLW